MDSRPGGSQGSSTKDTHEIGLQSCCRKGQEPWDEHAQSEVEDPWRCVFPVRDGFNLVTHCGAHVGTLTHKHTV